MKNTKKGFIPVMLMPFKDNGEIDYDGLTAVTEFYLEAGAAGLFANCLSSEMFDLSPEERVKATKHIVDLVNRRIPIVATGNFGKTIPEQADFVKKIYQTGVEAVILVTSLLADKEESNETFIANTFKLMELTEEIPLGFYECPLPYKRVLTARQLKLFLETNRVIYHKDTCLDIGQVRAKIAAARGHNFGLYDAYLGHAVESLTSGSDGLSCIQGNFFPEVIVWVCNHYDDPDLRDEVQRVQKFLIDNMDVMHAVYPPVAKYFLQKRGMDISTFCRNNKAPVNSAVKHDIDQLFNDYATLKADLAI
jgi:4-hydroxy-tetrahydrodipicolinate synthase